MYMKNIFLLLSWLILLPSGILANPIKGNYSAIALHLNPRLKYTAKRPIKRQNKVSIFLAYVRYFLYLYTYERASYGHIKCTARHDSRDKVDA